jgi:hypothetical protein
VTRPTAGSSLAAWEQERAADLRRSPNSSKDGGTKSYLDTRQERGDAACGITALVRPRANPDAVIAVRLPCRRKACPYCGPRRRLQLARSYLELLDGTPLVRLVIARGAWQACARRLKRAGAEYLRIPAPGDRYVVLASAGLGEPVTDLAGCLADTFGQMPSDTARVSSTRGWSLTGEAAAAAGGSPGAHVASGQTSQDDQGASVPAGFELLGLASIPLDQLVRVARHQGIYAGQVEARTLPAEWAEAHLLRVATTSRAWRKFTLSIGLQQPSHIRRRIRPRAA